MPPKLARRRGIHLAERLEQPVQPVDGNADAGVADRTEQQGHAIATLAPAKMDADFAAGGELHRVADQVDENLTQPGGVAENGARDRVIDPVQEVQTLVACGTAIDVQRAFEAFHQVHR
ncbi:MAG: hypothetical protein IPK05_17995, partial [Comamonadaceae bacterium]|nr:hypothetical protein [Comamonadaceae bacterium]